MQTCIHTYIYEGCMHTHMHIHTNTHKHIYTYLHSYMHTMNFTYVTGFAKAHHICTPCTMAKNIFITNIIDSSINKLTKLPQHHCQKLTGQLFLRPVRRPQVLRCSLNTAGRLVQLANLLKVTSWLAHDVGHGFIYILWHFECNGEAISPRKLLSFAVTRHFMATHHPLPSTPI